MCITLYDPFLSTHTNKQKAASEVIAIRERQDAFQGPYAEAWASFHLAEMVTAEAEVAKRRAAAFEDRCGQGNGKPRPDLASFFFSQIYPNVVLSARHVRKSILGFNLFERVQTLYICVCIGAIVLDFFLKESQLLHMGAIVLIKN